MSLVTSCIEPCKTKTSGSLIQILYISFIFILVLTNTGRMNYFLTTEVQSASQDLEKEARKCMIFSSFYYIIFILSQIPEQAAPFTCSQTLPCISQCWKNRKCHKSCAAWSWQICWNAWNTNFCLCLKSMCIYMRVEVLLTLLSTWQIAPDSH